MPINASLFALIENDAFLKGTYGLEGHSFVHTITYLKEYFDQLSAEETVSPEYFELVHQLQSLATIEKDNRPKEEIVASIGKELAGLAVDGKLLVPGGWLNRKNGHAMIYQFTRDKQGYSFTVFNAGEGLKHHTKKSLAHKDVYNPAKTWSIPLPDTTKAEEELEKFVKRLYDARDLSTIYSRKKPIDGDVLYNEILSKISYVNGKSKALLYAALFSLVIND